MPPSPNILKNRLLYLLIFSFLLASRSILTLHGFFYCRKGTISDIEL
jgi:hypothetical protein